MIIIILISGKKRINQSVDLKILLGRLRLTYSKFISQRNHL